MAHEIWGQRFYARRAVPAWHGRDIRIQKGIIQDEEGLKAGQILDICGEPDIREIPLKYQLGDQMMDTLSKVIIRMPEDGEKYPEQLGIVSNGHEVIYPRKACEIWDTKLNIPVETFAFLRKGAYMFITGVLPTLRVKGKEGEEVKHYLVMNNPIGGGMAASSMVTGVRVVCMNTLRMAEASNIAHFRVIHNGGAAERLGKWMKQQYDEALLKVEVLQEAYDLLASTKVTTPQIEWINEQVYRMPNRPDPDTPRKIDFKQVMEAYEYRVDYVNRSRQTILDLWGGKATGFENSPLAGTAYHAYNCYAEFETFRRGTSESEAFNGLYGDRARTSLKAYNLVREVIK